MVEKKEIYAQTTTVELWVSPSSLAFGLYVAEELYLVHKTASVAGFSLSFYNFPLCPL